jgi:hypothetical protein
MEKGARAARRPRGAGKAARVAARLIVLVACLAAGGAFAQGFDQSHGAWQALLKKHVIVLEGGKSSRVSYAGLAGDREALKSYLGALAAVAPGEFAAWTREQQIAFLVNAYNAAMVEKVLGRYPRLGSVWDLGRIFSNPFKDRFIGLFGAQVALDDIEHEYLRKRYGDSRVHFALNCASVGCPMLRPEAYVGERLGEQLDDQATRFLSDRSRNRFAGGASGARLEVSKIFDWYKEDFQPLPAYFARHAKLLSDDPAEQARIAQGALPIVFLDYDWALNDLRR